MDLTSHYARLATNGVRLDQIIRSSLYGASRPCCFEVCVFPPERGHLFHGGSPVWLLAGDGRNHDDGNGQNGTDRGVFPAPPMGAAIADESDAIERSACGPSDGGCLVLDNVNWRLPHSATVT